jgi:hypothetical protein
MPDEASPQDAQAVATEQLGRAEKILASWSADDRYLFLAKLSRKRGRAPHRHVTRLYERVARRKGHQKAIGTVARHLAEATYWVLTKQEFYREPQPTTVSSTGDKRG